MGPSLEVPTATNSHFPPHRAPPPPAGLSAVRKCPYFVLNHSQGQFVAGRLGQGLGVVHRRPQTSWPWEADLIFGLHDSSGAQEERWGGEQVCLLSGKRSCARPGQLVEEGKEGPVPCWRPLLVGFQSPLVPSLAPPPSACPGDRLETPPQPHNPPPAPKPAPPHQHPSPGVVRSLS